MTDPLPDILTNPASSDCYDRQGKPISIAEWSRLRRDFAYKVLRKTHLRNGREVSTVWLGMNHGWGEGPPIIFESMIFSWAGDPANQIQERYYTEEEALRGHGWLVRRFQGGRRIKKRILAKKRRRALEEMRKFTRRLRNGYGLGIRLPRFQ